MHTGLTFGCARYNPLSTLDRKVDAEILDRLIDRFESLDVSKDGMLDVGIDIPSPAQVQESGYMSISWSRVRV